jgi:predicted small secreted protein
MKDTFYFSHDYNTRTDEKIKRLIRVHGMAGYGMFWCLLEDLYNNANALRLDYEGIAFDLHTDSHTIDSIINEFELFVIDGELFGSDSVARRLNLRNDKSEKARGSALKRWNNANALRTQSDGNAIKESKENKNKENEINGSLVFYDSNLLQNELLQSEVWKTDMAQLIKSDVVKIDSLIKTFCLEQKTDGMGRSLRELRSHFKNWMKKELEKPTLKKTYEKITPYEKPAERPKS